MSQNIKCNVDIVYAKLKHRHVADRFSELVRIRLTECGWRDKVKLKCRQLVENSYTFKTCDELNSAMLQEACAMVPASVKEELLRELKVMLTDVDKSPPKGN